MSGFFINYTETIPQYNEKHIERDINGPQKVVANIKTHRFKHWATQVL